ncbi:MAG TPA: hypothetical protein VKV17_07205 [Bryobacteraceae bacterium]|nr:hypothetical protein [Bryobacteraceae bacterium]
MKTFLFLPACGLALLMAGCSEQPTANTKKAEKPDPVSGQSALFKMYQVARTWAPDAEVTQMKSIHLTDVPAVRGEAGAWEATFYSPGKSAQRNYTYSVEEGEANLHQGVFPGQEESASAAAAKAFLIGAVKIDSGAAYKTALAHAAEYNKKNAGQTISFELGRGDTTPNPVWRVIWGESAGTSDESVLVDATSGEYLKTLH